MDLFMTAQEFKKNFPDAFFVKTRKFIDKPSYQLVKESYIPEDDSPFPAREQLSEKTRLYPLSHAVQCAPRHDDLSKTHKPRA